MVNQATVSCFKSILNEVQSIVGDADKRLPRRLRPVTLMLGGRTRYKPTTA
jgi:hypothetical protein